MRLVRNISILLVAVFVMSGCQTADPVDMSPKVQEGNKGEREEWFKDLGLGMFIHWSVDSQLGSVISHSLVGASEDYQERFFNELPHSFYPKKFDPDDWARLAKLAGFKYVIFTTKHHSGFCMYDTETTDFNIMNTPYGKDITREIVEAFQRQGVNVGFYFSPDDFHVLHGQGKDISRRRPEALPSNNPELMAHNKAQVRELLRNYEGIDFLFLDGEPVGLKELAWRLDPEIIITRGQMETPEQKMPTDPMPGPWEACFTLGTQWHFKPTNEDYKSGTKLIEMLIEIRAKGGNLLLNIGPTPEGEIPFEQSRRVRELALWMFVNREAIYEIQPWHVIREGDIWFTKAKDEDTVYAFVTKTEWPKGQRKEFTLKSVRATEQSEIEILGQSGRVLEYNTTANPKATWTQDNDGLHISAMRAQRLYNDTKWPNPVVIKITHAEAVK